MRILNLNDHGTKAVLRELNALPENRIGRGALCAVYDAGPHEVLKISADVIQLESVRFYLQGTHYPAMTKDIGYVGTQFRRNLSLVAYQSERLNPLKTADKATKKLARDLISKSGLIFMASAAKRPYDRRESDTERRAAQTLMVLESLAEQDSLPLSLREALADVHGMAMDYGTLSLDISASNLMVRGTDELVLNDIIVDGSVLFN